MTVRHDGLGVTWLGYATVRVETPDGFVAYVDPGGYGVLEDYYARDADLICVTHDHHYDSDGIERVADEGATVVVSDGVDAARIDRDVIPPGELPVEVRRVDDETHLTVGRADLWTVPAFNAPDGPHTDDRGAPVHPRGRGCGFRLSLGGVSVFWPGDTDAHAALERLEASLFLAPIGGGGAMDRHEAAELAEALDPGLVVPVHYDTVDALAADAEAFVVDVATRGIPVVLEDPTDLSVA